MRFEVLGPLVVRTSAGELVKVPDRKVRALLADLLVSAGRPVSADRLIDDLWGEELPANPTATLQTRVSQLRKALEDAESGGRALVVTRPPGYLLDIAAEDLDAGRFRALAERARGTADPRQRASLFADALGLWRGHAFADVGDEPFARAAIDRLDEERLVVMEEHAETRLDLGDHDLLVAPLGELTARYPYRQRLRAIQVKALYRTGRHAEALEAYQSLRTLLTESLGLDPDPELDALHQAVLRQDPGLAAPVASRLPSALTPLIGRDAELADLLAQDHRLITLTGPGGVGKTVLALEAARRREQIHDVRLVELATLPADATPEDLDAVIGPAPQTGLLVLDNCEHVVDRAAKVIDRLLRESPRLRVLATSREPLGISGEQVRPVRPLDLPVSAVSASASSAVRLFVARAADSQPGFALTPDTLPAVVEICRRLDGLPLALELAATRIRSLGLRELAERLDDRFRILATRRQTLRAVIEWSWGLLSADERAVLRRLAMHADGWTLRAAEHVCAEGDVGSFEVADLLSRLVDRSLVVRADSALGSRFRLLESIRAFALEQLAEAGELDATRARYVRYYEGLAQRTEPRLYGFAGMFTHLEELYSTSQERTVMAAPPATRVRTVASADGTDIAYQRSGDGPPLIIVGGALNDRTAAAALAQRLSQRFAVHVYDRRGRGHSGDHPAYSVQKELDDLAALGEVVAGVPYVLGFSSGAVLAAEAAARGLPMAALALIEPPFILDQTRAPMPADMAARLTRLISADRRGDAVELFLINGIEMPAEVVAPMRGAPLWPDLEAMAHTIPYELAVMDTWAVPDHWARVRQPALVIVGSTSAHWRRYAARAVADTLPAGRLHTLDDQPHDAAPHILAPILEQFFLA
ncbi:alpha/beta fold hydrolase [Spirillospora sp. CA-294931]|uniref:AfsR/SARP family transcriptional regulator n=1 Tax=Spirillospora sp. CA-294931 TaxID=3240042 RepID=UPI003D8D87EA